MQPEKPHGMKGEPKDVKKGELPVTKLYIGKHRKESPKK